MTQPIAIRLAMAWCAFGAFSAARASADLQSLRLGGAVPANMLLWYRDAVLMAAFGVCLVGVALLPARAIAKTLLALSVALWIVAIVGPWPFWTSGPSPILGAALLLILGLCARRTPGFGAPEHAPLSQSRS